MDTSKVSRMEVERFFGSPVWEWVEKELQLWVEDVRDLLEDPSGGGAKQVLSVQDDQIYTARLRGSAEALRNVLNIKGMIEEQLKEEEEDDGSE